MRCEATPLPKPAFCIPDGGGSTAGRDPAAARGSAKAGVSQVTAPFPPPASSGLLLPGFLALCPAAAAMLRLPLPLPSAPALFSWSLFSAAPQSASGSSGMWVEVLPSASLLLCSPGSASVPWFCSTRACSLSQQLLLPTLMLWDSRGPGLVPHGAVGPRDLGEQSKPC